MKILVADDEEFIRMGLMSLEWDSIGVELAGGAANGPEVLKLLAGNPVDILLTDIRMPGMSGLELIRRVNELCPGIKCILLTGYGEFSYAQDAIRLGVFDYLLKPCDPEKILSCVKRAAAVIEEELREKKQIALLQNEVAAFQNLSDLNPFIKGEKDEEALIGLVMKYLKEHFSEEIQLKDLAEYTHFNAGYLSKVIKKKTGQNFLAILTQIRVGNAAWLLLNTGLKNYEIAERVGIPDERYFGQVFKKTYQVTPTQYRNQKQERLELEAYRKMGEEYGK